MITGDIIVICIGALMIGIIVFKYYHDARIIKQIDIDIAEVIKNQECIQEITKRANKAVEQCIKKQKDEGVRYNSLKRNTVSIEMVDKDEIEKDFYMINIPDTPLDVETKDTTI